MLMVECRFEAPDDVPLKLESARMPGGTFTGLGAVENDYSRTVFKVTLTLIDHCKYLDN